MKADISNIMIAAKKMRRESTQYLTNIDYSLCSSSEEFDLLTTTDAFGFVQEDHGRKNLRFAAAEAESLQKLLGLCPKGILLSYVHREKRESEVSAAIAATAGWEHYATYLRQTVKYKSNPYLVPDERPRYHVLQTMYDPTMGEFASVNDVQELMAIHADTFDYLRDDFFTEDEWKDKIEKKQVLVFREDGKIVCYYVFRLEGKKLYSNTSVNRGSANIMYNLERRVFEKYWKQGVRVTYCWIDITNRKQFRRSNPKSAICIEAHTELYQDIYIRK